jgi:YggT family protein
MHAILDFAQFVIHAALELVIWIVILYCIASTLIAFEIIKLRDRIVFSVWRFLEAVAVPLLRPIRRFMPRTGQVDFSAFVLLVLLIGVNTYLIPPFFAWLKALTGGSAY